MTNYTLDYRDNVFSWSPSIQGKVPKLFDDKVGMTDAVVQFYIKNLSGKIFTLLDASIANERQLKAMKDTIRNYIANTYADIDYMCWDNQATDYCNKQAESMTDEELKKLPEVSLEEAIGV